jgi:hypothetical protein
MGVLVGFFSLLAGGSAASAKPRPRPNVVIVVLDTVRAAALELLDLGYVH